MRNTITVVTLALVCTLASAACEEACGCPPVPPEVTGMLFGTVFTPDSTPIQSATVELTGGIGACEPTTGVVVGDGVSDVSGAYEAYFEAYDLDGETFCVVARAMPPTGSPHGPSAPIALTYDDENYNQQITHEHDFYLTTP